MKVKLTMKEAFMMSNLLENEISSKEAEFTNTSNQEFKSNQRQVEILKLQRDRIDSLKLVKEKIDAETFGKHG